MTWHQALDDFKMYLKIECGLTANSVLNYEFDIKKLIRYLDEFNIKSSPETINEEELKTFIYAMSKVINARSQARLISGLKRFFNYLIFENQRADNPMALIESPKIGQKLPEVLSTAEIDKLISSIDLTHPQGERNRAIIETLYACGLRVSELTHLKLSDLFFDEGFIKVHGKGQKDRFVPINSSAIKYINLYKNDVRIHQEPKPGETDILFLNRRGKRLTRAMVFTIIKQLTKAINLQKTVSPHTFRHSFATHLLENGADLRAIQQMLGHESIITTEIYTHLDKTHLKNVIDKFHPMAKF
ncbi:site-specific tyrosine recombinase XerD [Psychroflexus sp. MBR-150]|jgi:integrase/recombinase XerD